MTKLEALGLVECYSSWNCWSDEAQEMDEKQQEAYELLIQALTPPTSDEVCKALSEELDLTILFNENDFYYYDEDYDEDKIRTPYYIIEIPMYKDKSLLYPLIHTPLPPHLITLIGRFYEGIKL